MLRKLSLLAILGGSIGVPYAVFNGDQATQLANDWLGLSSEENPARVTDAPTSTPASYQYQYLRPNPDTYDPTAYAPPASSNAGTTGQFQPTFQQAEPAGTSQIAIAEVLRMDITRHWVTERWARVTTTLADTKYDGLRIAFISGTQPTDVTGSLTYYFDRKEQLQRITFHGTTGDPQLLTQLLTQQMEFEKQTSLGGELYTRSWLGQTTSVYRIRPAGVLHNGASNSRYEILLELNRSEWTSNLSDTAKQLVQ